MNEKKQLDEAAHHAREAYRNADDADRAELFTRQKQARKDQRRAMRRWQKDYWYEIGRRATEASRT